MISILQPLTAMSVERLWLQKNDVAAFTFVPPRTVETWCEDTAWVFSRNCRIRGGFRPSKIFGEQTIFLDRDPLEHPSRKETPAWKSRCHSSWDSLESLNREKNLQSVREPD